MFFSMHIERYSWQLLVRHAFAKFLLNFIENDRQKCDKYWQYWCKLVISKKIYNMYFEAKKYVKLRMK